MARSGNWITAGDGLGAFGAALILAVQLHLRTGRTAAGQWIYAKPGHALRDLQLISRPPRFSPEYPAGRAAARGNLGPSPSLSTRAKARPPQPRGSGRACHPQITGPGAEGGGGWPMHATAQPWHAEGLPLPAVALRSLLFCRTAAHWRWFARDARETRALAHLMPDGPDSSHHRPMSAREQRKASDPLFSCTFSCIQEKRVPGIAENPCSD